MAKKKALVLIVITLLILSLVSFGYLASIEKVTLPQAGQPGSDLSSQCPSNQYAYNETMTGTLTCALPPQFNSTGLVGYWPLDEGQGQFAYDLSKNGNTGTLVNSPQWLSGSHCMFQGCLHFNNTQYITMPNSTAYSFSGTKAHFTINFWVYPFSNTENCTPISKGVFQTSGYYGFFSSSKEVALATQISGIQKQVVTNSIIQINTWQDYTLIDNSGIGSIYKNGLIQSLSQNQSLDIAPSTVPLWINQYSGGGDQCTARYDNIEIFNYALSYAQVMQNYQTVPYPFETQSNALQTGTTTDLFSSNSGLASSLSTSLAEVNPQITRTPVDLAHYSQFSVFLVYTSSLATSITTDVQYSTNGGSTWSDLNTTYFSTSATGTIIFEQSSILTIAAPAQTSVLLRVEMDAGLVGSITLYRVGIEAT